MSKAFYLFFVLLIINASKCYIVLPVQLLPKENYKSEYDLNTPKDIMSKEFISSYYTELEVGIPSQTIPILIKQKTNDYIITSINPLENPKRDYTSKKLIYDFSEIFLEKYCYYNESKSNTKGLGQCEERTPLDEIEKPAAEVVCGSNETILLYNNIDLKEKAKYNNFYFDLAKNSKDNVTGVIGLGLNDAYFHKSFLSVLKSNNLIDNFFWFFEFDSWDSTSGKLILGAVLDNIYSDKYSNDDLVPTHSGDAMYVYWDMNFDEIYIKKENDKIKFINNREKAELNVESNLIIGNKEYKKYLLIILDQFMNEKCFNDTFKGYDEMFDYDATINFYYCKNEKNVKDKLYSSISTIYFNSIDLNTSFELTKEQILKENNEYIFINIVFSENLDRWILGKQIALKYKFMLNPETKNIYYYPSMSSMGKNEPEKTNYLKIILICALLVIVCVIGIIIGKLLYGKSKKRRANELKDDNYEYFPEENKDKDNKIITGNDDE